MTNPNMWEWGLHHHSGEWLGDDYWEPFMRLFGLESAQIANIARDPLYYDYSTQGFDGMYTNTNNKDAYLLKFKTFSILIAPSNNSHFKSYLQSGIEAAAARIRNRREL
jgi:hypothetical protein